MNPLNTPDFERFCTALRRQEPDRVPLAELHVDREVKEAVLGRPIRGVEDEVEFWHRAGYDYVPLSYGLKVGEVVSEAQLRTSTIQTLYGAGHEVEWADEGAGIITNEAEFEAFPWDDLRKLDLSALEGAQACLPPGMKVIVYSGKIFSRVWMTMGFVTFCHALNEHPDLVERMFQLVGDIQFEAFERVMDFDTVGGIWVSDDIAYAQGLMIAPHWYRRFLFPWYKKMGAICKDRGLLFIYHSDGRLWEVMEDIVDMGFDALHPIEPKAMDIAEVKRRYGDRLALIGNIDLSYTLTRGTPAEVEAEVKERLRTIAPGGGYGLGSANSVTHYVPLANYHAMREAVFQYGRYPIAV